jgi:hypothetical protein
MYMSKIDSSVDQILKDIFKKLINYQGFESYLEFLPFQTI